MVFLWSMMALILVVSVNEPAIRWGVIIELGENGSLSLSWSFFYISAIMSSSLVIVAFIV